MRTLTMLALLTVHACAPAFAQPPMPYPDIEDLGKGEILVKVKMGECYQEQHARMEDLRLYLNAKGGPGESGTVIAKFINDFMDMAEKRGCLDGDGSK